ncbi:MAG: SusE domain-containing protein [Bacteroidales bacterium]|nr:MAG: SusE domain-containing protein [Bacteroidales bacterium]
MKKIFYILIPALVFMINACEDDKENPVFTPDQAVAPAILTPASGGSYVLSAVDDTNRFESISWTAADYGAELSRNYTVQIALAGTDFADPLELESTAELSSDITVGELNLLLYDMGLEPGVATNLELRVNTYVPHELVDDLMSETVNFSITTFGYSLPSIHTPEAGSYTLEIDTLENIPFEVFTWDAVDFGGSYTTRYTLQLDTVGNNFADAQRLYSGEDTSWSATMYDMNDNLLDWGFEEGSTPSVEIRVAASTSGLRDVVSDPVVYSITIYTITVPETRDPLYLVGDATTAGWDNANGLPILWDDERSVYTITTTLTAGGGMKILEVSGQWAPQWGDDGTNTGVLSYRPDEATTDPPVLPSPGDGTYRIDIDIDGLTYSITPV